ncbi:hypothetical protein D1227_06505 [Henriciella mobilis]|uniref:hypothetical protein n=1 Tax=Henriciella mobilis TaxID=2305467 RepID=UPI000E661281|nr:hypothetical protein [Henriciella mobilis]RIJ15939.1 hypothetical protein D1231_09095 [Henriciella mobilis]RIJ21149.1 hypothetical protein D1227_12635 [Henriciella mobilis]RIJ23151.1 hypothetical protein D1227_06505 [Henriciella mobilis]
MARISRWFLDITLDAETLHWWSGTGTITFESNTYTGLGDRWTPPDSLKRKSSLKSEKIDLEFDSSRQSDNSDPIGGLLDEKWRNRAIRLRRLAWDAGDGPDDGDVLEDERGRIRNLSDTLQAGSPAIVSMEIESGALAYLERRMETRSPAGQQRVFAGDKGFDLIAKLEGKTLAWRTKHKKAGTVQYELQEEYEPAPRELVLGRFAKTGSFVAAWTHQQQNKSLTRIYAIADHRINKLDKVWINGDLLIDGALSHGVRTEITALRSGGPRAWITFYDGRPDQTADSFLQSVEPTWTSAHRLRGVAYVIIDHRWDSDLANAYDYRFGGEGARLYDRRLDTTAGGSGSQRWDDPSTWTYTTNAMVAADHYRSGIRIMSGSSAMWFGVGEAVDAVPYAEFAALADHSDENVALKAGGTQKRYEVNGVLSAADDHAKNLEKIARQMAARAIDQGGRIAFRPPIERTPVITLTDGDLKRGTESVADPGGLIDDMVNTLSGRFINPDNDYKKDDYPEVSISSYVDDDNGEISDTLDLDLEISGERSQRIAKLKIEDSRRIFQLTETYTVKARVIEPGEWFVRESAIRGFPSGKTFVADEVTRFLDGSIEVVATEIDPAQLVWDEGTAVDLSAPPSFDPLTLPDIDPPSVTATAVELGSGGNLTPGIQLAVTLPADLDDIIADRTEMEYGFSDGASSPGISGESFVLDFDPRRSTLVYAGFQPSRDYVFRFRGVENRGDDGKRYGEWSDFQEVTTTANATATSSGSAAAVPWSGVTNDGGKPDDNADVTGDNTAAAIAGQGSGATANSLEDLNASDAAAVVASYAFRPSARTWSASSFSIPGGAVDASIGPSGGAVSTGNTGTAGPKADFPVAGKVYRVRAAIMATASDGTWNPHIIAWNFDEAGDKYPSDVSHFSVVQFAEETSTGEIVEVEWLFKDSTVSIDETATSLRAGASRVRFTAGIRNGGVSASAETLWLTVEEVSIFESLRPAEAGADVTSGNTAAAIAGQGAFATKDSVAYGSGYLTGFGSLAALAFTTLGSNVRLEDGSTSATDALLRTSLGTAAAFIGQGALATLSSLAYGDAELTGFGSIAALSQIALGSAYLKREDGTTSLTDSLVVTSLGTAAAIDGQGSGATADTLADLNADDAAAVIGSLTSGPTARTWTKSTVGALDSLPDAPINASGALSANGNNSEGGPKADFPVSGKVYRVRAGVRSLTNEGSWNPQIIARSYDEDGVALSPNFTVYLGGAETGSGTDIVEVECYYAESTTGLPANSAALPAGAARVRFSGGIRNAGASATGEVVWVQIDEVSLFESLRPAEAGADVTSGNTAAAISGQGALATLSSLAYGDSELTGFNVLATLTQISLESAYIKRADGTTTLTESLVITTLGVAASITGQGNQATASNGRGNTAARPASTGSWAGYANTETNTVQWDVPGSGWVDVASLPADNNFAASYVDSSLTGSRSGAGTVVASTNINISGGAGSYEARTELYPDSLTPKTAITSSVTSDSTVQLTATFTGGGQTETGRFETTITDGDGRVRLLRGSYSFSS